MTVFLVNLTNPMMLKGPIRELFPIGPQEVTIQLPEGVRADQVQLLISGNRPEFQVDGRAVTLSVPSVLDLEIVAIDVVDS